MDIAGYEACAASRRRSARGELMGIGVAFFTEGVGAGPRKHMDILGLAMNDGADLRVHPSGKAVVSISAQTQGQGHETTFAQIVAEELDPARGRRGPARRHRPHAVRARHLWQPLDAGVRRSGRGRLPQGARQGAPDRGDDARDEARGSRVGEGRWYVKGDPEKGAPIEETAARAYSGEPMPAELEGGLDAQVIYDLPNLTYPYGAYIAVVDIDPDTAHVTVRRFIAVDDCGVRINPMIVDGQIHGGLAEGIGIALMEVLTFDEEGNRSTRRSWTT